MSFYEPKYYNDKNELKELLKAEIELDKTLLIEALKYPKFFSECELINTNIFNEFINELHETGKLNDFLNDIMNTDKSYLLPVEEFNTSINNYINQNVKRFNFGDGTSDMSIKQEMKNSKKQYESKNKNSQIIFDNLKLKKMEIMNDDFRNAVINENTTKKFEDLK